MQNLWNLKEAGQYQDDLSLRVYTSRLLGQDLGLVLQGGGNTSVKSAVKDIFGQSQEVLLIKGSGGDLATIEANGFAPVKLDVLKQLATLDKLTDTQMVHSQRAAMTDPYAPNPSVEAILHAIIPFKFVDHTHADAIVTITNSPHGEKAIRDIYGPRVFVVPYVMPGFILAKKVYDMTQNVQWQNLEGIILMNHGVFTFSDDAKESYDRMIKLVTEAEEYLKKHTKVSAEHHKIDNLLLKENLIQLAEIRKQVSKRRGKPVLAQWELNPQRVEFSGSPHVESFARRGPLTPDHVIRTKRIPMIFDRNVNGRIEEFAKDYQQYFERHRLNGLQCLDPAPRWAVWLGRGTISFGTTLSEIKAISDITEHTVRAIQTAEQLGGWKPLSEKNIFDVEYWELEQAKLKKAGASLPLQGKVAVVTGAASGIGKACVEMLTRQGAVVAGLDINSEITQNKKNLGLVCDMTKEEEIARAIQIVIQRFGGLDIVVSSAGTFPVSQTIDQMNSDVWDKSLKINLTSHQCLLKETIPYLSLGFDPTFIIVGSKNVSAPGPGASAYSVAKAGLTQLARVAALELASKGIRVNVVHPNQVFDTAIWTKDVLENRARHYGLTVEDYKKSNLLKVEITSKDVAELVSAMAGEAFLKTTGAQIPIDGGNERVI